MLKGIIDEGVLMEVRALKGKESGTVWRTIAKIAFTGGMVEAIIPEGLTYTATAGLPCTATGFFTADRSGRMEFNLDELKNKVSK